MTAVTTEDELFDDNRWETTVVKETDPLATLLLVVYRLEIAVERISHIGLGVAELVEYRLVAVGGGGGAGRKPKPVYPSI